MYKLNSQLVSFVEINYLKTHTGIWFWTIRLRIGSILMLGSVSL